MSKRIIIYLGARKYVVEFNDRLAQVNGVSIILDDVRADHNGGIVIHSGPRTLRAVMLAAEGDGYVTYRGREFLLSFETERHQLLKRFTPSGDDSRVSANLKASMPGRVVRIVAKPGAEVKKGQALLILEAMKMENEIRSPVDGTVKETKVAQGQTVEKGDLLMVLG